MITSLTSTYYHSDIMVEVEWLRAPNPIEIQNIIPNHACAWLKRVLRVNPFPDLRFDAENNDVMKNNTINTKKSVILSYQQPVYDRLCRIARACLYVDRRSIKSLNLRSNFLLIGPSGTGKTFLARSLAEEEIQVPYLSISVSDWLILGSSNRGGSCTWPTIFDFLEKNKSSQGAIIFIDEIDKTYHDSNWNAFLRSEVFSLCDHKVPHGLSDAVGDSIGYKRIKEVEEFLKYNTMIVAGAAFQYIWDNQSAPQMGLIESKEEPHDPELNELTKYLPRELINRFSSEIFVLPQLKKADYEMMIEAMAEGVPEVWRERFLELGIERLDLAVRHQKGARYAEEVLLSAIVDVRGSLLDFQPPKKPTIVEINDSQDDVPKIF